MTLVGLDHDALTALAESYQRRWTHSDELLATLTEQLDQLIRLTVLANAKNPRLPKPFRYPRPGEEAPKAMHPRDVARRMLGGRRGR